MTPREYVPIRLSRAGIEAADAIAAAEFEGNRSQGIRRLLELGLAAWAAGARNPDQVRSKR